MHLRATFGLLSLLLFVGSHHAARGQATTKAAPAEPPEIVSVTPQTITPGVALAIEGYRLGVEQDEKTRVLFLQGGQEFAAMPSGSAYESADMRHGLQELKLVVPDGLKPGLCRVLVVNGERRSAPVEIEIGATAVPPVLNSCRPQRAAPGQMVWLDGTGFSDADSFLLLDAQGQQHIIPNDSTSSSAKNKSFTLPELPDGPVTIQVVEQRSGAQLLSNALSLQVTHGPVPLDIYEDWLLPVAPGQWLDLVVGSDDPLARAERIEVLFKQAAQQELVSLERPRKPAELHLRVPDTLAPGNVMLQTRTWHEDSVSVWSEPISYELLAQPAAPRIYNAEVLPVRVEVAFKQHGQTKVVAELKDANYQHVPVPAQLAADPFELVTRIWRGGRASAWSRPNNFALPAEQTDRTLGLAPLLPLIYFGPDTTTPITIYRGERLVLRGTLPVAPGQTMQLSLQRTGYHVVSVPATVPAQRPNELHAQLPQGLEPGDWQVVVRSLAPAVETKLPVKLRVK